ncbi:biotin-dependent carboxyltransferase family protein [Symbioplanes lichenis]|uniref:5-oxoprolinase subunit C family protein n=1 Tax=Symbioplanes lichenis TaxID=1629072 RepID=UPI002738DFC7|nr:biotin-dependent carboxyltransferase family protein [Actinoplanes lichenis]
MTVLRTGPLTVFKDAGRPGHAHQGVPPSGAVDRGAYRRANALVGNPAGAAVLECTLGGLRVRFDGPVLAVLTGTDAVLTVDGRPSDVEKVVSIPAGAEVGVTQPRRGLRSYFAVRGGFDVSPVLGSRSKDRLAGIGPVLGTTVRITDSPVSEPEPSFPVGLGDLTLEVDLGPRDDWFTAAAVRTLFSAAYVAAPASDSVGLRLEGPALERARTEELPSEGVVRGAVQIPPSGQPIVFQADHPVTGGYPVIAVLTPAAADLAAQVRPGAQVRFRRARLID